jgi:hypothetical protein
MRIADPEPRKAPQVGSTPIQSLRHVIDPRTHGTAPHQPGIAGLQQFIRRSRVLHSGVEPQIVAVWIKDDWHPVVDSSGHGIRVRCQD